LIQDLIFSLTNLTKTHSKSFYPAQDEEVTTLLKRAFMHHENNSMLLLARSKQTLHSFISAVTEEVRAMFDRAEDPLITETQLKVIRVNSILSNSETKILMRLSESLKLRSGNAEGLQQRAQFQSVEMIETIKEYFRK